MYLNSAHFKSLHCNILFFSLCAYNQIVFQADVHLITYSLNCGLALDYAEVENGKGRENTNLFELTGDDSK